MRLLLMRHGIAAERDTWNGTDAARPLTPIGKTKTRDVARGLHRLEARIDYIATSPLLRARQTAEIVGERYDREVEHWPELETADWHALTLRLNCLRDHSRDGTVALLVGHEPTLSAFVARLLTGREEADYLAMKKAAVCALQVHTLQEAGATLSWYLPPRALHLMADAAPPAEL